MPVDDSDFILLSDLSMPSDVEMDISAKSMNTPMNFCNDFDASASTAVSFTADVLIQEVIPVQEKSIENESIPILLQEDQPLLWEMVPTSTNGRKPRLHCSDGFTFTV